MNAAVVDARHWASALVKAEFRGPGDLDRAMRRVESRYGIPRATLWALRYRAPRDVLTSIYFALKAAYEAELDRQAKQFAHELEIARAKAGSTTKAGAAPALVRAAAAVAGEELQPQG